MDVNPKQRRRHSAEFKAQVLAACVQPGASVAAVALSFKLNDNLVHQWRRGRGANPDLPTTSTTVAESAPQFIALSLPSPPPPPPLAPAVDAVAAESIHLEFNVDAAAPGIDQRPDERGQGYPGLPQGLHMKRQVTLPVKPGAIAASWHRR